MEIENRNIYSRKLDENMMQCYTDYIMMAWKQKRKGYNNGGAVGVQYEYKEQLVSEFLREETYVCWRS